MTSSDKKLSTRFMDALTFAATKHADQKRKGSEVPYIAHLLGTASIALEHGANEDEAIAALLHDVVEDQGGDAALVEVRERFGSEVARIVEACSDTTQTPKPPWDERKRRYVDHLRTVDRSIALVSASDKLYNAQSIVRDHRRVGEAIWRRFSAPREKCLWYYGALVTALRENPAARGALVSELAGVVDELGRLR